MPELPFDIGPYRVVEQVGIGGMGRVYRGLAPDGSEVAVKTMHPHLAELEEFVQRFMQEAERLKRVSHPGVVRVYEYGKAVIEAAEVPYIAMEFVHGRKLSDVIGGVDAGTGEFTLDVPAIDGKIVVPQEGVAYILRQMAYILQACDQVGVVHRDIKPDNIIITDPRWTIKLIDFGIAKDTAEQHTLSQTGQVLGTPAYMSPEQCRGVKEIDIRTDIYSLGVVAYRCLTGRLPFEAESVHGYIKKHLEDTPPPICELNPRIDENLALIVERMMAKEPENRHQSPDELIEDILRFERGEPPVRVYDWETRTTYETKLEMEAARKAARRRAKVRAVVRLVGLAAVVTAIALVLAFIIAPRLRPQGHMARPDLAKPLVEKGNRLVKTLPEAAAFWYEKARQKADTPTIRQLLKDALKAADAKPLLVIAPTPLHETLKKFIESHWAPVSVVEPAKLPQNIDWSRPADMKDILRGEHGVRYVLRCSVKEDGGGWKAVLGRFDLRTGAEIKYEGFQATPERALEDAVLAAVASQKKRRIHWLMLAAGKAPSARKAIEMYRKVLEIDPSHKEAREKLRRLYIQTLNEYVKDERYGGALRMAEEALTLIKGDREIEALKREVERRLRSAWLKEQIEEAREALKKRDWATAIKKAEAVLKERDDESARRLKRAAQIFRDTGDALDGAKLKTARALLNEAKTYSKLAPHVYEGLLARLKEAENRYRSALSAVEKAFARKSPQDVPKLVERVRVLNQESTEAEKLLRKAEALLSTYAGLLDGAKKAMGERRYEQALTLLSKAAEIRVEGPHTELRKEANSALAERKEATERAEEAFRKGDWKALEVFAGKAVSLYPADSCPERLAKFVVYARAMVKVEAALEKGDLKGAAEALKAVRAIGLAHPREAEIERFIRLQALLKMDLIQKSVDLGGNDSCICAAGQKPLVIAGLSDGRFVLLGKDGTRKTVFDPPKAGVGAMAAAITQNRFLLLFSDGTLQVRKSDGSLEGTKTLPKPVWACSLQTALLLYDGKKLAIIAEKKKERPAEGLRFLGAGAYIVFADKAGRVVLFDPKRLAPSASFALKGVSVREVVAAAATEELVAIALRDGAILLCGKDGRLMRRIRPLRWFATAVVFDRTGKFLFALDKQRAAVLIDVEGGKVVLRKRLDCWSPAEAVIVGLNDALAVRGDAGELLILLPSGLE